MLSCMRLSLFLAHCFSFSDKCVQYLDSASSYIWLTKLRFIPSITWRPKCPIGVIDKFLAEGTVQGEELYSMHMQFNSLSDYAQGLKFGRVRYLRAMCACMVPKFHWACWYTMCNFGVRSLRFNSKPCKHPEFHAPKKGKSEVLRHGDGLLFMKCKGRFAVGLHWKGSDWCRGLLCWSPLTLRGANQAFQHEKMTGVVLLHRALLYPVNPRWLNWCNTDLIQCWYSWTTKIKRKHSESVVTVAGDLPES